MLSWFQVEPEMKEASKIHIPVLDLLKIPSVIAENNTNVDQGIRKSIFKTATLERAQTRFTWRTDFDFALVSLACAVGVENFLKFPQLCKKYGGLAFCVPYLLVVIFMGLPLYFLETLLGQYSGHGTVAVMNELVPAFVGIGYALVINNFVAFMRNEVVCAKLTFLFATVMQSTIPWSVCRDTNSIGCYSRVDDLYCRSNYGNTSFFFNLTCTNISTICEYANASPSYQPESCQISNGSSVPFRSLIKRVTPESEFLHDEILDLEGATLRKLGAFNLPLLLCLLTCWALTYLFGFNGFSTNAKSAYFTVFAPLLGQSIIFLKAFSLPGAWDGIKQYLRFDPRPLAHTDVWEDAIGTCFSSLSLGLGLLTALGSASKPYKNCFKTSLAIICLDTGISLLSGLGIFALMGHLAQHYNVSVEELLAAQSDIIFTILPEALMRLDFPRIYVVICYASTTLMNFGYLAACIAMTTYDGKDIFNSVSNRQDDSEKSATSMSIYQFNIITCVLGFAVSMIFVAKGGTLVLDITDTKKHINVGFIIAALQTVVICFFFGTGSILDLVEFELNIKLGKSRAYWALSWNITLPAILFWAAFNVEQPGNTESTAEVKTWRTFTAVFTFYPFLIVLGFFLIAIYRYRREGLWQALQPTRKWCMGLDTSLLLHAKIAEPEAWKQRSESFALPEKLDPSTVQPVPMITLQDRDGSSMHPLALSASSAPSGLLGTEPMPRSKSIFNGKKARAFIDHTIRKSSYVPFGKQVVEGRRIRRSLQASDAGVQNSQQHVSSSVLTKEPDTEDTQ